MKKQEPEVYRKIKLLGEGSFGQAFLVECQSDKSLAVIKQVNINKMSEKERQETLKEAHVLEALIHPNIVRFREVYKTKRGKLCIVMDYADGGDLGQKIKEARGRYFPEKQILDWFTQTCLALKHVHDRKILHRDIKAQNIFLTKTGIIKMGDFGIARVLNTTREYARTQVGTPYYLSPEIAESKPYSYASDIWSIGVLLYELCALRPPFDGAGMPQLMMKICRGNYPPIPPHYSRDIKQLISQLLTVSICRRPRIQDILKQPFIKARVQNFLSETVHKAEFCHTILHKQKFFDREGNAIEKGPPSSKEKENRGPGAGNVIMNNNNNNMNNENNKGLAGLVQPSPRFNNLGRNISPINGKNYHYNPGGINNQPKAQNIERNERLGQMKEREKELERLKERQKAQDIERKKIFEEREKKRMEDLERRKREEHQKFEKERILAQKKMREDKERQDKLRQEREREWKRKEEEERKRKQKEGEDRKVEEDRRKEDAKEKEKMRFMKENEAIGEKLKKVNDFLRNNKQLGGKGKVFDPRGQPLTPRCRPEDRGSPIPVPRTPRDDYSRINKIQPNFMVKDYKPYKYEEVLPVAGPVPVGPICDRERKKSPISIPSIPQGPKPKSPKKNIKERLEILRVNQEEEKRRQERLIQGKELESKANELRQQKSKEREESRRLMFEQIREQQRKLKKLGKKGNKVEVEFVGINPNPNPNAINDISGEHKEEGLHMDIGNKVEDGEGMDYKPVRDVKPPRAIEHKKRKSKKKSIVKDKKKSRNKFNKLAHCQSVEEELKDEKEKSNLHMKRGNSEHSAPDTEEEEDKEGYLELQGRDVNKDIENKEDMAGMRNFLELRMEMEKLLEEKSECPESIGTESEEGIQREEVEYLIPPRAMEQANTEESDREDSDSDSAGVTPNGPPPSSLSIIYEDKYENSGLMIPTVPRLSDNDAIIREYLGAQFGNLELGQIIKVVNDITMKSDTFLTVDEYYDKLKGYMSMDALLDNIGLFYGLIKVQ